MGAAYDVLQRRGLRIDEQAFAALLDEALAHLLPAVREGAPRHSLTRAEAGVLAVAGADLSPLSDDEPDPLQGAAAAFAALLASARTVAEAAAHLGIDASRVRHRLAERTLFGVRMRDGWRLPAFQFTDDGIVPGLPEVLRALPSDLSPLTVARWLTQPLPDLELDGREVSPLAWLAAGGSAAAVVPLAAAL